MSNKSTLHISTATRIWQTIVWNWQNLVWTIRVILYAIAACYLLAVLLYLRTLSVDNYDWDKFYSWHEPTVWVEWDELRAYPGQIYTYSTIPIPLDPKIDPNYRHLDRFEGLPVPFTTEEYLGSEKLQGPIQNSFVNLGTDGIAIIDLMKYCPLGFIAPKRDKVVEVDDGHFTAPLASNLQ